MVYNGASAMTRLLSSVKVTSMKLTQVGKEFKLDQSSKTYAVFECACGDRFIEWVDKVSFGGIESCRTYSGRTDRNSNEWQHRNHPLFPTWRSMKERCYNKHHISYNYYGGRGITVCSRWKEFEKFCIDMGDRPDGTTLDRIDGNKNYCPENCKWSTKIEQMRNTKANNLITINGITRTVTGWSEQPGAAVRSTIYNRLYRGWPEEEAVFGPLKQTKKMA